MKKRCTASAASAAVMSVISRGPKLVASTSLRSSKPRLGVTF